MLLPISDRPPQGEPFLLPHVCERVFPSSLVIQPIQMTPYIDPIPLPRRQGTSGYLFPIYIPRSCSNRRNPAIAPTIGNSDQVTCSQEHAPRATTRPPIPRSSRSTPSTLQETCCLWASWTPRWRAGTMANVATPAAAYVSQCFLCVARLFKVI